MGEKVESEGVGQETDETQASVDYAYLKIGRERYAAKVGDVHCSLFFRETKFLKVKYEILLVGFNVSKFKQKSINHFFYPKKCDLIFVFAETEINYFTYFF